MRRIIFALSMLSMLTLTACAGSKVKVEDPISLTNTQFIDVQINELKEQVKTYKEKDDYNDLLMQTQLMRVTKVEAKIESLEFRMQSLLEVLESVKEILKTK